MSEKSTLARPYAQAAFKQAQQENTLGDWSDTLGFLGSVVTDPQMAGLIADPRVEEGKLADLLLQIGEGRLSDTGQNFVRVLVENRRLSLLPEIAEGFEAERAKSEGRSQVEVVSAFELDSNFQQIISGAMAKRLGRAVDLLLSVDKSLIGGVIIRVGDVVIDASLRGRLKQLALNLT